MNRTGILLWTVLFLLLFTACGGGGGSGSDPVNNKTTYTVGGAVSGLSGQGPVLQNNGADDLAISGNGLFTFPTAIEKGTTYNVTIKTQPVGQKCSVSNASGTITEENITDVTVICTTKTTYTVGGVVSGLSGQGLVLQNNGADDLAISGNGLFTFPTAIENGTTYNVTIKTQPVGQKCSVSNANGTITGQNVTEVTVICNLLLPSLKWKLQPGAVWSTAAVGGDGTLYMGTLGGVLYALNPEDGTTKWTYRTYKDLGNLNPTDNPGICNDVSAHSAVQSSPAIGPDGSLYFGTYNQTADGALGTCSYFYALNPDGTLKWRFLNDWWVNSSPAISADGQTVYVGFENFTDSHVYAFSAADGTPKWAFQMKWHVFASPAVASDGTIYVPTLGDYGALYALNPDGTLKWKYFIGDEIYSSPAIGADGTVYVGSTDTYVYAINPDGTLKWKYQTDGQIHSSPAVDSDGTIYIGSGSVYDEILIQGPWGRYLYAIRPDGTLKWRFDAGSRVNSSPAIGNDGTIWIGSYNHYIYLVNPDGTMKWKYDTGGYFRSSPLISNNGMMYIGTSNGYFFAFQDSPPPSKGSWPMFRHDPMHTGRVQ